MKAQKVQIQVDVLFEGRAAIHDYQEFRAGYQWPYTFEEVFRLTVIKSDQTFLE